MAVDLLHLVQRGGACAGCSPAQSSHRCTKCNSPFTNGQFTNHCIAIWWSVLCGFNVAIKGLIHSQYGLYMAIAFLSRVQCSSGFFRQRNMPPWKSSIPLVLPPLHHILYLINCNPGHTITSGWINPRNGTRYRHSFNGILTRTCTCRTQGCHFEWPWVTLSGLAKYSMTRSIARPLCDSWASYGLKQRCSPIISAEGCRLRCGSVDATGIAWPASIQQLSFSHCSCGLTWRKHSRFARVTRHCSCRQLRLQRAAHCSNWISFHVIRIVFLASLIPHVRRPYLFHSVWL